jgi:hypothetical protein
MGVDGRDKRGHDAVAEPSFAGSTASAIRATFSCGKAEVKLNLVHEQFRLPHAHDNICRSSAPHVKEEGGKKIHSR